MVPLWLRLPQQLPWLHRRPLRRRLRRLRLLRLQSLLRHLPVHPWWTPLRWLHRLPLSRRRSCRRISRASQQVGGEVLTIHRVIIEVCRDGLRGQSPKILDSSASLPGTAWPSTQTNPIPH